MVNGIESGREFQDGKGSDRPFGHIEKNIVNIKEGTFSRMVFSITANILEQLIPFAVSLK